MFPGLGGGMNPKQMAQLMRQMGIKNTEVEAKRVVVEKADGSKMIVEPASVTVIEFQGQKSLQVSGNITEESSGESEGASTGGDVELVMEQTGATKAQAEAALEETGGDLAAAILKLKKD